MTNRTGDFRRTAPRRKTTIGGSQDQAIEIPDSRPKRKIDEVKLGSNRKEFTGLKRRLIDEIESEKEPEEEIAKNIEKETEQEIPEAPVQKPPRMKMWAHKPKRVYTCWNTQVRERIEFLKFGEETNFPKGIMSSDYKEYAVTCAKFGWKELQERKLEFIPTFVREFYEGLATSHDAIDIRKKVVPFSIERIRKSLKLPNFSGTCPFQETLNDPSFDFESLWGTVLVNGTSPIPEGERYPGQFYSSSLTPRAKVWSRFIIPTFFGIKHTSELKKEHIFVIKCILEEKPFDVAKIIYDTIMEFAKSPMKQQNLKFPCTITQLCLDAKIPRKDADIDTVSVGVSIALSTIKNIHEEATRTTRSPRTPQSKKVKTVPELEAKIQVLEENQERMIATLGNVTKELDLFRNLILGVNTLQNAIYDAVTRDKGPERNTDNQPRAG